MPPSLSSTVILDERISADLEYFATISEPGEGCTRLAYSELERVAHRAFAEQMVGIGAQVHTDAAGNTIAELPATEGSGAAAIGTGSHLDSVPGGGRFDGVAGVVAAMEVARAVAGSGLERRRPWRFVAFAAEEGARFGQACNGSRMIAGLTSRSDLDQLSDARGITMAEAMAQSGLDPDGIDTARWNAAEWHAFVELHIEQGSVLESARTPVGVVDSISGSTRLLVTVEGQASHTGGTPMRFRRDALVTASECVLAGDAIASDPEHHGTRVTVGRLDVHPGSITTIPGLVVFTVDIRDIDSDRQRATAERLSRAFSSIAARRGTRLRIELLGDTSPVFLPRWVADEIVHAAQHSETDYRVLTSGASHDSQQVNRVVPTAMIFVPSRDGLSHVPEEYTAIDEIATGTRVLLAALARLDATA